MTAGRPRKPAEQHRRNGNPGGRPLPDATIHALPSRNLDDPIPKPPTNFGKYAKKMWNRVWNEAIHWCSPTADFESVEAACRAYDLMNTSYDTYRAEPTANNVRAAIDAQKAFSVRLIELGLGPTGRAKLATGEVVEKSKLEQLKAKKQSS